MFAFGTLQRAVMGIIQEAPRAVRGLNGRLLPSSAAGERPALALASQLEGCRTMSALAVPSWPAPFAFPDPFSHAAESAVDCSLHRPAASANGGGRWAEMAQTHPMVAGSEAAVEDAAAGGSGAAQRGRFDEGGRVGRPQPQPDRSRPPLGLRSCSEVQRRLRAGLTVRTDGLADGRTVGRAEEAQEAASLAYFFMRVMRI